MALFKIIINQNFIGNNKIELLRCNVSYKNNLGEIINNGPVKIVLDPLNENAFSQIAEDEKVKLRLTEITVARFQERAWGRRSGDWATAQYYIDEARKEAKDNEWLNSAIDSIEVYAKKRQQENFSKEAMYSAEKMNKRLVSDDEINMSYDINFESEKQSILEENRER